MLEKIFEAYREEAEVQAREATQDPIIVTPTEAGVLIRATRARLRHLEGVYSHHIQPDLIVWLKVVFEHDDDEGYNLLDHATRCMKEEGFTAEDIERFAGCGDDNAPYRRALQGIYTSMLSCDDPAMLYEFLRVSRLSRKELIRHAYASLNN